MQLRNILHNKYILIGSLAIVALLGSAVGAIAFDFDHLLAFLLGIEDGRFLHHPQAILCCILFIFCCWRAVQLVRRLYNLRK